MLLGQGPKVIFFGGKGGVGKTTLAAATAAGFAAAGERTLLVSTDPAHSLSDLLDMSLGDVAIEVAPHLHVRELDPEQARSAYLAQVKENMRRFAAPEFLREAERQVELSGHHPGVAESALFEALCRQLDEAAQWDRIIIDTAPTGHTLHLLTLPESMRAWTDALLARQAQLPASVAPEGQERWQKAREILEKRRALFERSARLLRDPAQAGFMVVINDDRLSVREGARANETLLRAQVSVPGVIVNRANAETAQRLPHLANAFAGAQLFLIPWQNPAPQGLAGLQPVTAALQAAGLIP